MKLVKLLSFVALVALTLTTACGGSSGVSEETPSLAAPTVNLTGSWDITEVTTTASGYCSPQVGYIGYYVLDIVQNGNNLTVTVGSGPLEGTVFNGTISGNNINWSGTYPEDGGTTRVTQTNITATDSYLSGTANWEWSDEDSFCEGTVNISGYPR